jgi:hypothetical protein
MKQLTTTPKSIFQPTPQTLSKAYGAEVDRATKDGTLKPLKHAPVGASKATPVNINNGKLGVGRNVYDINGTLFLKTQVVAPNAQPKWFKVGPAPLF